MADAFVPAAKDADIAEGHAKIVEVGGVEVALCRVEGTVYGVENKCSHDDGPLGEGELEGYAIVCPRHGAKFDVRTGEVLRMPAAFPCRVFRVKQQGDALLVDVGPGDAAEAAGKTQP